MKKIGKSSSTNKKVIDVAYIPISTTANVFKPKPLKKKKGNVRRMTPTKSRPPKKKKKKVKVPKRMIKVPKMKKDQNTYNPVKTTMEALYQINTLLTDHNSIPSSLSIVDPPGSSDLFIDLGFRGKDVSASTDIFQFNDNSQLQLASMNINKGFGDTVKNGDFGIYRLSFNKRKRKRKDDDEEFEFVFDDYGSNVNPQPPKRKKRKIEKSTPKNPVKLPKKKKKKKRKSVEVVIKKPKLVITEEKLIETYTYLIVKAVINYFKFDTEIIKNNLVDNISEKLLIWTDYLRKIYPIIDKNNYKLFYMTDEERMLFVSKFIKDNHGTDKDGSDVVRKWWTECIENDNRWSFEKTYLSIFEILEPQLVGIFEETMKRMHEEYEKELTSCDLYILNKSK